MIARAVSLIALGLLVVSAAPAAGGPIFPPLVSGEYCYRIRAAAVELDAQGVPTTTPTRSVASRIVGDPSGALYGCQVCAPGEVVSTCVVIPAAGDRAELRGYAFAEPDCSGGESAASDNGAYVFFMPPSPVTLELAR